MTKSLPARTSHGLGSWSSREPFASLRQEMNDLLSRFSTEDEGGWLSGERIPTLDLMETDTAIEVKVDVPGIKPDEIDIEVRADSLMVSGEHKEETKEEKEDEGKTFHRIERRTGSFSRMVPIPCPVDEETVTAQCSDGVLTINLPKTEESKSRKIKVRS